MADAIHVTIDDAGRIVVPKPVRDRLGLTAGRRLRLVERDDGLELRVQPVDAELVRSGRVWQLRPREPLTVDESDVRAALERLRAER